MSTLPENPSAGQKEDFFRNSGVLFRTYREMITAYEKKRRASCAYFDPPPKK